MLIMSSSCAGLGKKDVDLFAKKLDKAFAKFLRKKQQLDPEATKQGIGEAAKQGIGEAGGTEQGAEVTKQGFGGSKDEIESSEEEGEE